MCAVRPVACDRCSGGVAAGVAWGRRRCGPSGARGVPRVAAAADTLIVGATYSSLITSAGVRGACLETPREDMSVRGKGEATA